MTHRTAPGVIVCFLGLVLALAAVPTEQVWFAVGAGVCALVSGLLTLGIADHLASSRVSADAALAAADEARAESDVMAARAARFEAEAIMARAARTIAAEPTSVAATTDLTEPVVTDPDTGLFNAAFFAVTLEKRVSAARRGLRPLALALLEPVRGLDAGDPASAVGRPVADCLIETLRDSDIACRLDNGLIGLILEDTPENGAVWTVERVRRRLASVADGVALRAGVACYPAHAFDADQLHDAALAALRSARDWHQDRIEVAAIPDD